MTLLEKLGTIHKPPVKPMTTGFSETAEDFWKDFILLRLPKKEIALQWHKVLMEYVNRPNATFALRFYNTATKDQYSNLRRGFLTKTDKGYSFSMVTFLQLMKLFRHTLQENIWLRNSCALSIRLTIS